jgi:hypothetical protein
VPLQIKGRGRKKGQQQPGAIQPVWEGTSFSIQRITRKNSAELIKTGDKSSIRRI